MGTVAMTMTEDVPVKIPQPLEQGEETEYVIITYESKNGKETLEF